MRAVEVPESTAEPRVVPTARERLSGGTRTVVVRLTNPKGRASVVTYGVDGGAMLEERKIELPWEAGFTADDGQSVKIVGHSGRFTGLVAQILVDGVVVESGEGNPMVSCRHRLTAKRT